MSVEIAVLAAFLDARLTDTEAAILDHWDSDGRARVAAMWTGGVPGYATVAADHADGDWVADGRLVDDARHITVLFDPARVLADVAAKRRVVAEATGEAARGPAGTRLEFQARHGGILDAYAVALRALASGYAAHPDFQPEWAR